MTEVRGQKPDYYGANAQEKMVSFESNYLCICYSVLKDRYDLYNWFFRTFLATSLKPVILVLTEERKKSSHRRTLSTARTTLFCSDEG
jgi:hypothetical protein